MARYLPPRRSSGGGRSGRGSGRYGGRSGRGSERYGGRGGRYDDYDDGYGEPQGRYASKFAEQEKHEKVSLAIFGGIGAIILFVIILLLAVGFSGPRKRGEKRSRFTSVYGSHEEVREIEFENEVRAEQIEAQKLLEKARNWALANQYEDKEDKIAQYQELLSNPRYKDTKAYQQALQDVAKLEQLQR